MLSLCAIHFKVIVVSGRRRHGNLHFSPARLASVFQFGFRPTPVPQLPLR
jgi:hypothetical protein